ncbi:sugar phosphate nucleotidyltransferase [Lentisphaerota bacterium WC36G]|nr:CBS domain-containing protein [Lentisphaerae bacterium WC36]
MTIENIPTLSENATILEALKIIDYSGTGMALITDENRKLIGVLSDGDIRRLLINGATIEEKISNYIIRDCFTVSNKASRAEILDLMQARKFSQVPVVDDNNKLIGLHLLHSMISKSTLKNKAVIMVGGKGTRLGKLTATTPKPMLKVAGRPILERIILHLISHGVVNIYLAVNHLSDVIEEYFGSGEKFGCSIKYLRENEPLGSGGALSLLDFEFNNKTSSNENIENDYFGAQDDQIFVMNGDLILEADLRSMLKYHCDHKFYATMGVSLYHHEVPFGCVISENDDTNNKKRHVITQLEEKPNLTKKINSGIYIFSPKAVKNVPKNEFFPITELFNDALENDLPCGSYLLEGDWHDIGQVEQFKKANGK